ncbi:MAG: hypothetical protein CMK50_00655 [Propionibacteriaceae bacterium]|nr:hypothetical protein [Propionibacteriaceae bacterium]
MGSCNKTDRGKIGCRFCAPWPHNVPWTHCVELRPWLADGEAPASGWRLRDHDLRCPVCYAEGALSRHDLTDSGRELALANEARRRDLAFTIHEPSKPGSKDERTLSVQIRRRLLPIAEAPENEREPGGNGTFRAAVNSLAARHGGASPVPVDVDGFAEPTFTDELDKLVQEGREARCPWSSLPRNQRASTFDLSGVTHHESDADYDQRLFAAARSTLRELLAPGHKLQRLLAHPEFAALCHRIEQLAADPPSHVEDSEKHAREEKQRLDELVGLLNDWTWSAPDAPKRPTVMACRNAIIADFTIVLAGCVKSNAVPLHLGAGAGSKAAAMYQIKCAAPSLPRQSLSLTLSLSHHSDSRPVI